MVSRRPRRLDTKIGELSHKGLMISIETALDFHSFFTLSLSTNSIFYICYCIFFCIVLLIIINLLSYVFLNIILFGDKWNIPWGWHLEFLKFMTINVSIYFLYWDKYVLICWYCFVWLARSWGHLFVRLWLFKRLGLWLSWV